MSNKLRIGVIGATGWTQHLPVLKADPRVDVVAICGRNKERTQEMAAKHGNPKVFTHYQDMFASHTLQAVVIATPDDEHCKMTMAALDAGLHVLCEKPLASSAKDAKAMYDKAEATGLKHMAYFNWRWMPHHRTMHDLIEQGVLGRVYHAEFNFLMGFGRDGQYYWRFDPLRANGVLGDLGSHMFDLSRHLVGDIASVSASLASFVKREGLETSANDSAMVLTQFANGAQGTFQLSFVARVDDPILAVRVALHGEAASLVAELKMGGTLELAEGDEPFQPVTIPAKYLEAGELTQLFVDAILEDKPVTTSFYEGWKAQQVIDAAITSHESKQWVSV
jgi:predicted dehydrogenase